MKEITWNEFERVELRVGTIIRAEVLEGAKIPAYKIWADFGSDIGQKQSSTLDTRANVATERSPKGR